MLTEKECKNFKAFEKCYKKFDEGGLYLLINPDGRKYWKLKYRYAEKEKKASLGIYPEVSLKEARLKREEYKKQIREGNDPTLLKKQKKLELKENVENTFEKIAREWHSFKREGSISKDSKLEISRLERYIFPYLGNIPINKITAKDIISTIRKIEEKGVLAEARKVRSILGQIFKYAIATKRTEHNLMADTAGAYKQPKIKHYPAFSEKEFIEFIRKFDSFNWTITTKLALKFLILTFVRSGEVRGARWKEIDFEKKEWRIPAERMKMKEEHVVPLSKLALRTLEEAYKYSGSGGSEGLIFPAIRNSQKEMSDSTLSKALRDKGYQNKATPHGMRQTASTIFNERGEFRSDVIERQLAHCERNKVRASYNHAQYMQERRKLMDWWGNYVEKIGEN